MLSRLFDLGRHISKCVPLVFFMGLMHSLLFYTGQQQGHHYY